MKIKDIQLILEGFKAWHSTDKDFEKFEDGHNHRSIFGEGIYFELTGADENFVEYCKDGSTQIKAYINLDFDKEIFDANKTLEEQGLSLTIEDIKNFYKNGLISGKISKYISSIMNEANNPEELKNNIANILNNIHSLLYEIYKNDVDSKLKSILGKEVYNFYEDIRHESWTYYIGEKAYEGKRDEFFKKYDLKNVYGIYRESFKKLEKILLFIVNKKLEGQSVITQLQTKNSKKVFHSKWPQFKGIVFDSLSVAGTEKEMKSVNYEPGHTFKRRYLVLWDAKYAQIISKRKKINQQFDDEIDDEILQHQLDNVQG